MSEFKPHPIPDGITMVDGKPYMGDGKGGLRPVETIKAQHKLTDELVRKVMGYAIALSEQIARFRGHTFDDISSIEAMLAQEYGAKLGGPKGNMTLMTVDKLFMVKVQVSDRITFGPELQTAKALFNECLTEWAADARPELRSLITNAFDTDKEGNLNRARIFMLLRVESDDERFKAGQRAINDAKDVLATTTYVRCYQRPRYDAKWDPVVLDLAKVAS